MLAPSADRPQSETCVWLFKIIVLKKDSKDFVERYTTEIKKQNVTTKSSPQKVEGTSQNGFVNSMK
jgi:hypothetical protein